jgi:hypothetical protein
VLGGVSVTAFLSKSKKIALVTGFIALVIASAEAWSVAAPIRGRLAAWVDVRHGHYRLLVYGLPPPESPEYEALLRGRYDIEMKAVAGCTVSESLVSYVAGYDALSAAAARRKYGHDVFKECEEAARRSCESKSFVNSPKK